MNSDMIIENGCLTAYNGDGQSITIPEGVVSIAPEVFRSKKNIKSVSFPSSLKTIEDSAFLGCTSLTDIAWSSSVKTIGNHAFANCSLLTSLSLPEGLETIGQSAFSPCTSLESVSFPHSLKDLGEFAFSCCRKLTDIRFSPNLSSIGRSAFSMCTSLKSVVLPEDLRSLVRGVFLGCSSLKEIAFGPAIRTVENNAFSGCTKLLNINVDADNPFLKDIDGILYSRDEKTLFYFPGGRLEVFIPEGITCIADESFYDNKNFDRITLPESLISIGKSAFYGCSELMYITLPEKVTSLGDSSFERCSALKELKIPESVKHIGASSFRGCKNLMWLALPENLGFDLHWFAAPNDPPCFSADHTIIPFVSTRKYNDITSDIGKRRAALGLILAQNENVEVDTYLCAAYIDYIRANIIDFYDDMLSDDDILKWFADHKLIPVQDIERLLERASGLGRASACALLLDYQSQIRQHISAAPSITIDDRFDALDNALNF